MTRKGLGVYLIHNYVISVVWTLSNKQFQNYSRPIIPCVSCRNKCRTSIWATQDSHSQQVMFTEIIAWEILGTDGNISHSQRTVISSARLLDVPPLIPTNQYNCKRKVTMHKSKPVFLVLSLFQFGASLVAQKVKNLPAVQETQVCSMGREDSLKKGMATYSSILAWRITWTEEPGGLQFMGSQRVRHDWMAHTFTFHLFQLPTS